jgi:hypothetical protein
MKKMYKGREVVNVHRSAVQIMKNRGWADEKPTPKKKPTKKEVSDNG